MNGFVDSKNKNFNVEPIYQELNPAMPMNIDGKKEISVFLFAVRKNDKFFYIDQKGKEFYSK